MKKKCIDNKECSNYWFLISIGLRKNQNKNKTKKKLFYQYYVESIFVYYTFKNCFFKLER